PGLTTRPAHGKTQPQRIHAEGAGPAAQIARHHRDTGLRIEHTGRRLTERAGEIVAAADREKCDPVKADLFLTEVSAVDVSREALTDGDVAPASAYDDNARPGQVERGTGRRLGPVIEHLETRDQPGRDRWCDVPIPRHLAVEGQEPVLRGA